jgi:hypothetical protein
MGSAVAEDERTWQLLLSVAEQLKVPLTHIARQTELVTETGQPVNVPAIAASASMALTLVDSYLLGLNLLQTQGQLQLEPVSVSSLLVDVAHALDAHAQQYGVPLELHIGGRYEPVMAHAEGLRAALLSLGFAMVEAQSVRPRTVARHITLAGQRKSSGIVAGMYGHEALDPAHWRKALQLCGKAQQPLAEMFGTPGAGVFIADMLAQAMETKVRVGRHSRQAGFAVTLQPSQQLQFI